ncbi:alpha/beta fold hydrolase [Bordetella genomosp. 9]|nr:alpha/beta hydrolase [Bordetella genomosp. 9]
MNDASMTFPGLQTCMLDMGGRPARILRGGDADAGTAMVFVHGGAPGLTPYGSGAHIWGQVLRRFAADGAVLALDLPGFGGTEAATAAGSAGNASTYSIESMIDHIDAVLRAAGIRRCHIVAHDTGGLAALLLACRQPGYVEAVSVVSSVAAAPTGDGVENLTLAHPPLPAGTRDSQRWALERVSYSHHHVRDVLDDCVRAARQAPALAAAAHMADAATRQAWAASLARSKARLFELCRDGGVPVPVQVIWGTHDPLATVDQGMWLYRILAQRQPTTHFHLINRAGALPFREEPDAFHAVVSAFSDALR